MDIRMQAAAAGPCAGIRVLDFSTVISGPMCTLILGDLGADVIKVEPPRGDTTRMMGPPFKGGLSAMFTQFNRNKRSIVVDLKRPEGVAIAERLATTADVVVENFRPDVPQRLGIDYPTLSALNERLVYVAISGFGPEGPYVGQPAYDTVMQGLTGFMPVQGAPRPPVLIRSMVADKSTALTATYGVLAALLARERSGQRGQLVTVPMLDAYSAFMLPEVLVRETFLPTDEWESLPDLSDVHRTWETADGHVVLLIIEDSQFQGLCRALDRLDLIDDPRCSSLMMRIAYLQELLPLLAMELKKWSTSDLLERAHRFGAPMAPVNTIRDFLADPQVTSNRTVFEAEDEEAGRIRYLRNPLRLNDTPPSFRHHPPRLGQHTDEVLRAAGYADGEIAELRSTAVVA